MTERWDEGIWFVDSGQPGRRVCISFGVHGNERPPIEAGAQLQAELEAGDLRLDAGSLLVVFANPVAAAEDRRWSEGGVDLNRCFHPSVLAREPELFEERRARQITGALERFDAEVLVDFHCTVEPGPRFLMMHPPVDHAPSREVYRLLQAEVMLSDPDLNFGGVSLDEWMTTRGRVGICYETGWIKDPQNTPEVVLEEMKNVLAGLGLVAGSAETFGDKDLIELQAPLLCEASGFAWSDGIGQNLQNLSAGTVLGRYPDGNEVRLDTDATLIFPKKQPEMVQVGKPLVYLARARQVV